MGWVFKPSDYHNIVSSMCRFYHSSIAVIENLPYDDFLKYYKKMQNAINEMEK